jgi:hypothetical protein
MIPLHAYSLTLPPDYFSPGTYTIKGRVVGSPWAIAYHTDRVGEHASERLVRSFRFEREELGAVWRLVSSQ